MVDHDTETFWVLFMTFPMLMLSNMILSLPEEENRPYNFQSNSGKWLRHIQLAFMKGFSWDILDVAELTFEDFGCFQTYEQGWLIVFDIFLLVSIFLTSFYSGIEQPKEKIEDHDKVVTLLKLIFNDVLLLMLRSVKISKQGHPYGSIIFITKEVFSIVSRLTLLFYFSDSDNIARYNQLDDVEAN